MTEKEFNQNKKFVPTKSFSEYVEEWKNCKKYENPLTQTTTVQQLESRIKELENNTTELIIEPFRFGGRNISVKTTKCCDYQLLNDNENFCPNCGRKIVR